MKKSIVAAAAVSLAVIGSGIDAFSKDDAKGAGNLRYTISVSKFANEAGWSGKWNVGDGFTTIMTDALQQSGHFIVLGDAEMRGEAMAEQDLATDGRTAGGKKAPKTGRMTPAQLLVRGSVTHVQEDTGGGSGGIGFKGIKLGGSKAKAEVNITVYLVDSATGQVKASQKVVGESSKKGLGVGYSGSALGGLTGDMAGFKNDNVGKACENAVAQSIEFLIKQLENVPWQGNVMLAKGDKVIINRGTREGVKDGDKFSVGTSEELVDDDTGEVLDTEFAKVGVIEVTEAKEKIATCKAVEGGDEMEKGMTVVPAK